MLANLIFLPAILLAQWATPATGGTIYTYPAATNTTAPTYPTPTNTTPTNAATTNVTTPTFPTTTDTTAPAYSDNSYDSNLDFLDLFNYDNYFPQEETPLELLTRKRKNPFFYPALFENVPVGQILFKGSVTDPRWRVTDEGKLRGNIGQAGVLADLINGNVQINFSGGRNKIGGQITFYEIGESRNSQFVDLTNSRIYSEETILGAPSIFLGLLFNGPVSDPTLFGRIITESGGFNEYDFLLEEDVFAENSKTPAANELIYTEELFFITNKGSSVYPIKSGPSVSVPKITIPQDILDKIFETLFNEASAAVTSLSNVLRLINEYNIAVNDSFVIDEVFSSTDSSSDISYLSDEQLSELIGLGSFYNEKIENTIKPQLGSYAALTRSSGWYSNISFNIFELAASLDISDSFASFLLQVPAPFSVTFLKDGKITSADCDTISDALDCRINAKDNKAKSRLFQERLGGYDQIFSDYRQGLIDIESSLFGG